MTLHPRVAVLGCGIAGAAISAALSRHPGVEVFIVPGRATGSTFRNQKWKHSGLLYASRDFARQLWSAHVGMDVRHEAPFVLRKGARLLGLEEQTLREAWHRWSSWNTSTWRLEVHPLEPTEYRRVGALGETRAVGGFGTPDCVIDFPAVAASLCREAVTRGAALLTGASVAGIDIGTSGAAVVRLDSGEALPFDVCIVAMGAWSVPVLAGAGLHAPVVLRRCLVLHFDGEIVPALTVCLDVRSRDNNSRDASLTPFQGLTIGAEADGDEVSSPWETEIPTERIESLIQDYERCFPRIREFPLRAQDVCFKLEERGLAEPTLDHRVFDSSNVEKWDDRIMLALPGKASLALPLGAETRRRVLATLSA
jgi:glycine/D-amino acid oxidase-like deaminating enzyme